MNGISRAWVGLWFSVGLLATGNAALGSDERPGPAALPRLEVEQDVIDFGELLRGKEAEASFVVRNTGGATLRILNAKPG